jgi:ribosomal protein S18 acetylase RimI-like enzyme
MGGKGVSLEATHRPKIRHLCLRARSRKKQVYRPYRQRARCWRGRQHSTTVRPVVPNPSQFVLTFLQSVGRRQESDYYLKLFRELPKPSFAVIAAEPQVFDEAPGALIEPLRFLSELDLFPILATGLLGTPQGVSVDELCSWMVDEGLRVSQFDYGPGPWAERIGAKLEREVSVVVDFSRTPAEERFAALSDLLATLATRKLVLLRSAGGLGPKEAGKVSLTETHHVDTQESGISVINLRTDYDALQAGAHLQPDEQALLAQIKTLHDSRPPLLTSIASPLNLLRELFTMRGAGTLIKTGSPIQRADSFAELDVERVTRLLDDTFGKVLKREFLQRACLAVYVEAGYRGLAVVEKGVRGAYLTKFAVDPTAQGEGIGRDLWEAMLRDHPCVYWRARVNNASAAWYQSECDGMHAAGAWRVYWRGMNGEDLPIVIADALARPLDFEET